jgi:alkaline phosphatase D
VAVELVGTSITSDNVNELVGQPPRNPVSQTLETAFRLANPHVKLLEFDSHGFSVVDITPERLQMDWYYLSERTDPAATCSYASSMVVPAGTNAVQPGVGPLGPRA